MRLKLAPLPMAGKVIWFIRIKIEAVNAKDDARVRCNERTYRRPKIVRQPHWRAGICGCFNPELPIQPFRGPPDRESMKVFTDHRAFC